MDVVLDALGKYGPWATPPIVWFLFVRHSVFASDATASFKRTQRWLRHDAFTKAYIALLDGLLGWLARAMGDTDQLEGRSGQGWWLFGRNAWTATAYDRCLLLAVVYPLMGMVGAWAWFGGAGQIGGWELLGPTDGWPRTLLLFGLGLFGLGLWQNSRSGGWKTVLWGIVLVAGGAAVGFAGVRVGDGFVAVMTAVVVAFAGARAYAVIGAGAAAVAFAAAYAVALALSVALADAGAFAFADAIALFGSGAGGFAFIVALALALSSAVAITVAFAFAGEYERLSLFALSFWFGTSCGLLLALQHIAPLASSQYSFDRSVLVFLALVPLANAPLDWLSVGTTRSLLYAIRERRHTFGMSALRTLVDFGFGIGFFVLVAVATTTMLALVNRMAVAGGKAPLLDLDLLLTGIVSNPGNAEHYWIYLTLLTTLVPTALHVSVAALALVGHIGQVPGLRAWRKRAADTMGDDVHQRWGAVAYLTLVPLAALALAAGLIWLLLQLLASAYIIGTLTEGLRGWVAVVQG